MAKQNFSVSVFSKEAKIDVCVPATKNSSRVAIDQIIDAIRKKLNLNVESLNIFGLYIGLLGFPERLLLRGEMVPEEISLHLCFQRLSFDAEYERRITANDSVALDLIFCELKFILCRNRIWPLPNLLQVIDFAHILEKFSSDSDCSSVDRKKQIVEKVRSLSYFYWSRYYLVKECSISPSLAAQLQLGMDVFVALEFDKLVLIDKETSKTLSWCWSTIKYICLQKDRKNSFVAEVLVSKDNFLVLRKLCLETARSEYLFSVAIHILRLRERRAKDVPLYINWLGSFYIYNNPIFINPGLCFK